MKDKIHPEIRRRSHVTCSCGNTFVTRSTVGKPIHIEVCSGMPPVLHGQAEGHGHARAASTSSASATAAAQQGRGRVRRRRPDPQVPKRTADERGSFGCLFCSVGAEILVSSQDFGSVPPFRLHSVPTATPCAPPDPTPRAGRPGGGQPIGVRGARFKQFGPRVALRRVGLHGAGRARPVEDRGCDVDRCRLRDGQARRRPRTDTCGRAAFLPGRHSSYAAGAVAIKALSPPLQRHNAARLVAGIALALILLVTAQASRAIERPRTCVGCRC